MTLNSDFRPLSPIALPPPMGRQFYMHTFELAHPTVPSGYEDYLISLSHLMWALSIEHKLSGVGHLTIDERVVKAGMSQRRPKPHVDGCFVPSAESWQHGGSGGWLHGCNNIPVQELARMPVIVAASAPGCRMWRGKFTGQPASDGDLSHIQDQLDKAESAVGHPNWAYLLSADCVHESMIMEKDTPRTFIRIALPNTMEFR